jgi:hypothetical protein
MISTLLLTSGVLVGCFIMAHLTNHLVLEPIILGDPCEHDGAGTGTGRLFDLFYTTSSNSGYHPESSWFNFYFTTGVSALIGAFISYRSIRRKAVG